MLEWQLGEIAQCEVDEVVVVTGFGSSKVEEIVHRFSEVPVRTVHNPFYAYADNLGTCWTARHEMDRPFVLINGDTLFEKAILDRLLAQRPLRPVTLVTDSKSEYDEDDMKVVISGERLVRVGKKLGLEQVNGESIGMMVFAGKGPELFRKKLEQYVRSEDGLKLWYLSVIDSLAQEGHVAVCRTLGLSWCEVDDRADLRRAEAVVTAWPNRVPRLPVRAADGATAGG